jgi:ABC-type multidrug transport system ATPase subunit
MLTILELSHVRDVRIGGHWTTGISGGERKRVSIGLEILTGPHILFLDEPTTGLDSASAAQIIKICNRGRTAGGTVITTLHQPTTETFEMCDRLILIS